MPRSIARLTSSAVWAAARLLPRQLRATVTAVSHAVHRHLRVFIGLHLFAWWQRHHDALIVSVSTRSLTAVKSISWTSASQRFFTGERKNSALPVPNAVSRSRGNSVSVAEAPRG